MADWQFHVFQFSSPTNTARLTKYSNVQMSFGLNKPGSVTMTVDLLQDTTPAGIITLPGRCGLKVYRNELQVWEGVIWTTEDVHDGISSKITFTAVGLFEFLNHRLIRTIPAYGLQTSSITVTNPGFESAISGWGTAFGTAVRSTAVFDTGSASLLISENIGAPSGISNNVTFAESQILGSTPVSGRRYKLTFRARTRKAPSFLGESIPYCEVLESGVRAAVVTLDQGSTPTNYYTLGHPPFGGLSLSGVETYPVLDNANFKTYTMEWTSTGINPFIRWSWDVSPTQLKNRVGGSVAYWGWETTGVYSGSFFANGGSTLYAFLPGGASRFFAWTCGLTGNLDTTRVYKVSLTYAFDLAMPGDCAFTVGDTTGGNGFSIDMVTGKTTGTYYTVSGTFTPSANQPYFFTFNGGNAVSNSIMYMSSINIEENAADTDALINVDNISLQEYVGDGIYQSLDAGQIAINLLNKTNSDGVSKITPGTVEITQPRTRTYQRFSNIGKEIKALSDIEAGYDYKVDPITRTLDIYNRTNATNFPVATSSGNAGAGSWMYSADRTSYLRFDYRIGLSNVGSWRKTQDVSTLCNRMNVQGKYALGFAEDTGAQSTYGIFEDLTSLSDVIDASNTVLPAYANAEVAFRKTPKELFDIQLNKSPNTPELFIDFNVGDKAKLTISLLDQIFNQPQTTTVRIFGVNLSINQEGDETLTSLQLAA